MMILVVSVLVDKSDTIKGNVTYLQGQEKTFISP